MTAAVVFFEDIKAPFGVARWFRPGFRHCFAAVADPCGGWTFLEACRYQTFVRHGEHDDLMTSMKKDFSGRRHILTHVRVTPPRRTPLRPYTCVEAVKFVLGVHAPRVFTPWQLYNHLRKDLR